MNNQVTKVLTQTRNLLSNPSYWNRLGGAWTEIGKHCSPFDAEAKSFCLLSALQKFSGLSDKSLSYVGKPNHDNLSYIKRWPLIQFEMQANHSQMIRLLDSAIKLSNER